MVFLPELYVSRLRKLEISLKLSSEVCLVGKPMDFFMDGNMSLLLAMCQKSEVRSCEARS